VNALASIFAGVAPAGCPVSVGPPPGGDVPASYIAVGYGGDNTPSVVGVNEQPDMGNWGAQAKERYGVWCVVSTSSGDELGAARLAATSTIYETLVTAVRANRTLNGAIRSPAVADVGPFTWTIEEGGMVATVAFQVLLDVPWVG